MSHNALLRERPSKFVGGGFTQKNVANTSAAISRPRFDNVSNAIGIYKSFVWDQTRFPGHGFIAEMEEGFPPSAVAVSADEASSVVDDAWERVLVELESMEPGEDFIPPKKSALADLEEMAEILRGAMPLRIRFPDVEHDSSTGIVSLAWFNKLTLSTFSISLLGDRKLYSIFVDPAKNKSLEFPGQTIDSRNWDQMWKVPEIAMTVVDPEA